MRYANIAASFLFFTCSASSSSIALAARRSQSPSALRSALSSTFSEVSACVRRFVDAINFILSVDTSLKSDEPPLSPPPSSSATPSLVAPRASTPFSAPSGDPGLLARPPAGSGDPCFCLG